MSLARAFTTRRNRVADKPSTGFLGRSSSQRAAQGKTQRPQISSPINLISSTNALSFDAPNICGAPTMPFANPGFPERSATSSSLQSSNRSSSEHSDASSTSARDYSTDASSVISSSNSPDLGDLSGFFKPSVYNDVPSRSNSMHSSHTRQTSASNSARPSFDAPVVPQRAASHSKKAHMHVSRQRSISRLRTPPSTAQEFFQNPSDISGLEQTHPFGKELAQLNEVAEEFGTVVRDVESDADHQFMQARGLGAFCATEYMMEIESMLSTVFEDEDARAGWI